MNTPEQGDVLRVSGISHLALVVSNDEFNQIGEVIVCPILNGIEENAIHPSVTIRQPGGKSQGVVACEHLRHLDLHARHFSKVGTVGDFQFMDISDILIALLEYR